MSVRELAREMKTTPGSAHKIMRRLMDRGLLEYQPHTGRTTRLTPAAYLELVYDVRSDRYEARSEEPARLRT